MVTEGGDAGDGVNEYVEAGRVSDRDRLSDGDEGTDAADDGEIPLPWNSIDETSADDDGDGGPETFEDLRFVGPKTASALESSEIELSDFVRKRISYRELTEVGVNPGVAAKIRREHSLSWSFDATDTDLSRRSTQVRGLDDDEREWIASSTGWGDDEAGDESDGRADGETESGDWETETGETGGRRAGRRETSAESDGESAWREQAETGPSGRETTESDGEAEWRKETPETGRSDSTPEDEEAAWRAGSTREGDGESNVTEGEAAWRSRSPESDDEAVGDEPDGRASDEAAWRSNAESDRDATSAAADAEATWRAESAPTPVTVIDGVDETDAAELADAGIRSIRRLATADPESVADALQLDQTLVEGWVSAADERLDGV
ncbi:hypothetical protein SAMN04488063_1583 [Halopelagius inordinatus]|uniref:DUF7409 domain-containing protein n=2 Tax=Halopelagius inordinatus TaxID=553467 RepID=A0A1I2PNA2_9EURY|nr:hypothetical protein SAMN04488063_1583 [Halopelagius inordinatus]